MMISSIRAFPLLIILMITSLLIPTAFSDYLGRICSNTTRTGNYSNNLQKLFRGLSKHTPTSGFGNCSSGRNTTDRAFGLSLCRGSVPMEDCRACIKEAGKEITDGCPSSRAAIVWYDYCYLKYSDNNFFGEIDTKNNIQIWNKNNATDPTRFKKAATGLLRNLSRNAADTNNTNMFAGGAILFDKNKKVTIYGVAQCSRDLSKDNCQKCLDWAVNDLPWNVTIGGVLYPTPIGGRTLTGSCNVGYETYPFLN